MTLTDFLLARIAEEELAAKWTHHDECARSASDWIDPCDCGVPNRVLAECEAKRAIVDVWVAQWSLPEEGHPSRPLGGLQSGQRGYGLVRPSSDTPTVLAD